MDKNLIRKTVLNQRSELTALERSRAESSILESLINWDIFKKAAVIHIFISMQDEPNTRPIIEHCWNTGKKIAVPVTLPDTFDLFHSEFKSFDHLNSGLYGTQEPSPERRKKINPQSFDLVIIPGVAFDRLGGRLGHGKGYYDRFLEITPAFRLGLSFECQLLETVPTELHDVRMNAILSESGIFETNLLQTK